MLDRDHEADNLPACADNDVAFLAYSPLGQGLLTGKIGPNRTFAEGDQRRNKTRFNAANRERIRTMLDAWKPVAERHDSSFSQLAIAWTLGRRGCTHVLVGARRPDQVRENAAGGDLQLSNQDTSVIDEALLRLDLQD